MQVLGEDYLPTHEFAETQDASDMGSGPNIAEIVTTTGNRSAWVRVVRTENSSANVATQRRRTATPIVGNEPINTSMRSEIEHIVRLSTSAPDIREGIVASLRDRIESGTYFVGAETVAEMMLRRTLADRLR